MKKKSQPWDALTLAFARKPIRLFVLCELRSLSYSVHVRPQQGTKICDFGAPSPLDFLILIQRIFFIFSRFLCNLPRTSPQNVGKIARFPVGEGSVESCHVSACHKLHACRFLLLRIWVLQILPHNQHRKTKCTLARQLGLNRLFCCVVIAALE